MCNNKIIITIVISQTTNYQMILFLLRMSISIDLTSNLEARTFRRRMKQIKETFNIINNITVFFFNKHCNTHNVKLVVSFLCLDFPYPRKVHRSYYPHSWLFTRFAARVAQQVQSVKQNLLTLRSTLSCFIPVINIYKYWLPSRFPYQMMFKSFTSNVTGVICAIWTANSFGASQFSPS